jgi:hypothetical protein
MGRLAAGQMDRLADWQMRQDIDKWLDGQADGINKDRDRQIGK